MRSDLGDRSWVFIYTVFSRSKRSTASELLGVRRMYFGRSKWLKRREYVGVVVKFLFRVSDSGVLWVYFAGGLPGLLVGTRGPSICQVFFACQNYPEVLKYVLQ